MKKLTANKAAAEIRHKILRKMREIEKREVVRGPWWDELRDYIKRMARRASAKAGGLGRK